MQQERNEQVPLIQKLKAFFHTKNGTDKLIQREKALTSKEKEALEAAPFSSHIKPISTTWFESRC